MATARLRLRITSRWVGDDGDDSDRRLSDGMNDFGGGLRRVGSSIGRGLRSFLRPNLPKAMLLLAPAAFTMAKAALALAGGVAALGAVVTAAVAPWVGLAITAAMNADKMGAAGTRFQGAAKRVGDAWMTLARNTAPQTLGPVTDVLNGIAAAIPKLEPLVRDIAPEMADIARDLQAWLQGNGLERFLEAVRRYGVPAFRNLVSAGKDFVTTLGVAFREFGPLARDIAETIASGAQELGKFGKGGGFRRFLDDVKQEWPTVKRALGQLNRLLTSVIRVADSAGTGGLGALSTALDMFNKIDPATLRDIIIGWATGRFIVGLATFLAALAALQAAGTSITGGAALSAAAASLTGSAAGLFAMAAAIQVRAAQIAAQGARRANTEALDRIRRIWDAMPKSATATVNASSVSMAIVVAMGVSSTWATLALNVGIPIQAQLQANTSVFTAMIAVWMIAWLAVQVMSFVPIVFTASAVNAAATSMSIILIAWNAVRAQSRLRPIFSASANPGNVVGGAASIVAAWRRVTSMPRSWAGSARASAGNVPGVSSAVVSSWRRLYGLARSWSGVAICSFSGGFGGVGGGGGGGGGGRPPYPGDSGPFVVFPAVPFAPNTVPIPDFPDLNIGNPGGGQGVGEDAWDLYWDLKEGQENFNPGDWTGGAFAAGGPVGLSAERFRTGRGGSVRQIHIHEDVRVRDVGEMIDLLERAIAAT